MRETICGMIIALLLGLNGFKPFPVAILAAPSGGGGGCGSLPYTDNFTTPGSLSACWTPGTGSFTSGTIVSSGVVASSSSSVRAAEYFTGLTPGSTLELDAPIYNFPGVYSAICLVNPTSGNGFCNYPSSHWVCGVTALSGCSGGGDYVYGSSGDTFRIGWDGTQFYGGDVTTSNYANAGGSAVTGMVWTLLITPLNTTTGTIGPAVMH